MTTFETAVDQAARAAFAISVEGPRRTWLQHLRLAARDRFRPSEEERERVIKACKLCCEHNAELYRRLPTESHLRERVRLEVGFGPLTWLWIVTTVAQFLLALKKLLEPAGQETQSVN